MLQTEIKKIMKQFYFLFLLSTMIITGCQQQVPETVYDLDAQNIIIQTRAMKELTLYETPQNRIEGLPIKIFQGKVLRTGNAKVNEYQRPGFAKVNLQNEKKETLVFDVEKPLLNDLVKGVEVIVHYHLNNKKVVLLEIEKVH